VDVVDSLHGRAASHEYPDRVGHERGD
jgi:hypothetical protein